jgi:hypothetical protein
LAKCGSQPGRKQLPAAGAEYQELNPINSIESLSGNFIRALGFPFGVKGSFFFLNAGRIA